MNRDCRFGRSSQPITRKSNALRELQAYQEPELGGTLESAERTAAELAGFVLRNLPEQLRFLGAKA